MAPIVRSNVARGRHRENDIGGRIQGAHRGQESLEPTTLFPYVAHKHDQAGWGRADIEAVRGKFASPTEANGLRRRREPASKRFPKI